MKTIVVNATASGSGGALTILNQFIENIPADGNSYLIFGVSGLAEKDNVTYIPKNTQQKYFQRIIWELFGIKRWLKTNNITCDLFISFQNIGFLFDKVTPQIVYYHQPVSLFNFNWSLLRKDERMMFFYKNIYPLIVKFSLHKKTDVVVQLNAIKSAFVEKYNFPAAKVHVCRPDFKLPDVVEVSTVALSRNKFHFYYPCVTVTPYKNYQVLFEALLLLDNEARKKMMFHFSCSRSDFDGWDKYQVVIDECVVFYNYQLTYDSVLALSRSVNCVIFPSFIETFGLPLVEAAALGTPVLAAKLPYAQEVLAGYDGATFAAYDNAAEWLKEMVSFMGETRRFTPLEFKNTNSWNAFFSIINYKLNTHVQQ